LALQFSFLFLFSFQFSRAENINDLDSVESTSDKNSTWVGDAKSEWLNFPFAKIKLFKNAAIHQTEGEKIILLKGEILVQAEKEVFVETVLGDVELKVGAYRISYDKTALQISTILGLAQLVPLGEETKIEIKEAHIVEVQKVNQNGVSSVSVPQPVLWKTYVRTLAFFFKNEKSKFQDLVKSQVAKWQNAVEVSSQVHREIASFTVYQKEKSEQEKMERELRLKKERQESREWLWKKAFGD
jgi:hypothetical protein